MIDVPLAIDVNECFVLSLETVARAVS